MCLELTTAGLSFTRQIGVPVHYKGTLIAEHRPDLVVSNRVIVEIKSVERFDYVFVAQMLTYLRITGLKVGLILNFNRPVLKDGIRRHSSSEARCTRRQKQFSVSLCLCGPSQARVSEERAYHLSTRRPFHSGPSST